MRKKLCENRKKKTQMNANRWIHVKERGATRILFYSICAVVPVFITGVRLLLLSESKKSNAPFISPLLAEKSPFKRCVIQNWEDIESLKDEKVLEKSWTSVFQFPYEPCLNLLPVNCLVVELFCSHNHDRYANSMLYK